MTTTDTTTTEFLFADLLAIAGKARMVGSAETVTLDGRYPVTVTRDDDEGNYTAAVDRGEDGTDEFEIADDGSGESFLVTGPNHHYPDTWTDSLADAIATVVVLGSDGRTARHLVGQD